MVNVETEGYRAPADLQSPQLPPPHDFFGQLSELGALILSENKLTGGLPAEFFQLSQLRKLWLFDNRLTGRLPKELGQLSRLWQFSFRGNRSLLQNSRC